ncbi:biogenesis of lysosome-related organelles complex 1 subunit 3 isoform X1 [Uranotaenia lowii]|uniref:biogenesis of lysosome-related organelles complex 1 subunit 3 isoform X1 n=1 Tax=Uranotaenia lowii TaxID=190385 RepID=UPI002479CF00|nr:biogenesis of lysosome-related organelles complex 1 subunit 3 isoform X1 [Uranotaenia lowii]
MDSKTLHIIQGEASETDEELEINDSNVIKIESGPDAPPPISIQRKLSVEALDTSPCCFEEDMHLSELKNMINERCVSLLNEFIHTTAISVSKQLTEADNLLMKSQVMLQNTTLLVKKINESTDQMSSKLKNILSVNFIPKIDI